MSALLSSRCSKLIYGTPVRDLQCYPGVFQHLQAYTCTTPCFYSAKYDLIAWLLQTLIKSGNDVVENGMDKLNGSSRTLSP